MQEAMWRWILVIACLLISSVAGNQQRLLQTAINSNINMLFRDVTRTMVLSELTEFISDTEAFLDDNLNDPRITGTTVAVTNQKVVEENPGSNNFNQLDLVVRITADISSEAPPGFDPSFVVARTINENQVDLIVRLKTTTNIQTAIYFSRLDEILADEPATPAPSAGGVPTVVPPTPLPTRSPTRAPTAVPTRNPTSSPTRAPTPSPTFTPTRAPTRSPTASPTNVPTASPTNIPTATPTRAPTFSPTATPTPGPTNAPTNAPTFSPTATPTPGPTSPPTSTPTNTPTESPTVPPTSQPTSSPTEEASESPTRSPGSEVAPTTSPSTFPSQIPSNEPSIFPSALPSSLPSTKPSGLQSNGPSETPSVAPSSSASARPSNAPTSSPSDVPSMTPTIAPSVAPSVMPTVSFAPTTSKAPSNSPTISSAPTDVPSASPTEGLVTVSGGVRLLFSFVPNAMNDEQSAELASDFDTFLQDNIQGISNVNTVVVNQEFGIDVGRRLRSLQELGVLDAQLSSAASTSDPDIDFPLEIQAALERNASGLINLLQDSADNEEYFAALESIVIFTPTPIDVEDGLPGGAIAGIVIGSVLFVGILGLAAYRNREVKGGGFDAVTEVKSSPKKPEEIELGIPPPPATSVEAMPMRDDASSIATAEEVLQSSLIYQSAPVTAIAPDAPGSDDEGDGHGSGSESPSSGAESTSAANEKFLDADNWSQMSENEVMAGIAKVNDDLKTATEIDSKNEVTEKTAFPQKTEKLKAPAGQLGLVIDTSIKGAIVHGVKKDSPMEGKLFPGDIIVALDDVDMRAMSAPAIASLMIKTSAVPRMLTVIRKGDA